MTFAFLCAILLSVSLLASAQYIQIQALPQTVNYRENDLVIVCSITNPSQLRSVFFIELQKNSSTTFDTVVSVATGQTPPVQWKDTTLQVRASATGNLDSPNTAQMRFTIDKNSVQCPNDFSMYKCKMSGLSTDSVIVTWETSPIIISYIALPTAIELPRVKILNEFSDTPNRQFPVGTAITLTCQGEVGNDPRKTIRWCAQKANEMMFTGLPQTPIHSDASQSGCMFARSSTITYNLTSQDIFTKFLCESGDTGLCGTGTAIQYVNISSTAFAQYIQIQAFPQTVNYRENDLVIVCSITNPSQLRFVFYIQLQKNSSTAFDTIVSVATGQTPPLQWKDSELQNRATAYGNIDSPSTAQLRLSIDKNIVRCPNDFKMYKCQITGFNSYSDVVTHETNPITISYFVKPAVIEVPRVMVMNELYDTPERQFPDGTAITLTCQGQVGSDQSNTIRWCAQRVGEFSFTGLAQTPIHSEAIQSVCQYTRSSTITYNLTNEDTFTKFLCESGYSSLCGTGTAIQYVNISSTVTEGSSTTSTPSTDEGSSTINSPTTDDVSGNNDTLTTDGTSASGTIAGGVTVLILLIILAV